MNVEIPPTERLLETVKLVTAAPEIVTVVAFNVAIVATPVTLRLVFVRLVMVPDVLFRVVIVPDVPVKLVIVPEVLLKVVMVPTPVTLALPTTKRADVGFVDPIPRLPET